jgi:integrase/recombinase XerD
LQLSPLEIFAVLNSVPEPALSLVPAKAVTPVSSRSPNINSEHKAATPNISADRVAEFLRAKDLRPNSLRAYRNHLTAFVGAVGGLAGVTPRMVANYKDSLAGKSPATIAAHIASIRSFYRWMLLSGYVDHDPTRAISCPTPPETPVRALTPESFRVLLNAAYHGSAPERDLALLWLLAHGLRRSEVASLDVPDFDGDRVLIRQAKRDSVGTVPIGQEAASWIKAYLGDRADGPLLLGERNRSPERLTSSGIQKVCDRLSKASGVKFTAHDLRHTFGTQLMKNGMSAFDVQTLMRHSSPVSTRRYTKAANQAAAEDRFRELGEWL